MFMRNLGNTIGAALLGGILNSSIIRYMKENGGKDLSIDSANILLNEMERLKMPIELKTILQDALTNALQSVYIVVLVFAAISLLLIFFLPKHDKSTN